MWYKCHALTVLGKMACGGDISMSSWVTKKKANKQANDHNSMSDGE